MPSLRELTAMPSLGALACAALALSLACARSTAERSPQGASTAPAGTAPAPSTALDSRTFGWVLGKGYPYRLKLTTAIAFGAAPNQFDFDLTGQALVVPVRITEEEALLYLSVADARAQSRIPGSQADLDRSASDMRAAGIFFSVSGGKIRDLRLPGGQSQLASSSYRAIASALQFARAKGDSTRYDSEEYDTTGRTLTEYEKGATPFVWQKKKARYLAVLGTAAAFQGQKVPIVPEIDAKATIRLTPSGRPEHVTLHEKVNVRGAQAPIRSEMTLELAGAPEEQVAAPAGGWDARLAATTRVAVDQPIGPAAPVEDLDKARIGDLDFRQVLERLEQISREKAEAKATNDTKKAPDPAGDLAEQQRREGQLQEDTRLFFALSALFRQDPGAVPRALAAIRAKSPASLVLMDGLSSASSPAAQQALITLMDDKRVDATLRTRAIHALARTPKPSDASIRALRSLLREDPFDMRAIYGLGTYSRSLRDEGKVERAGELGELLLAQLKRAERAGELVTVLRGIANSGYAGALPGVAPLLKDKRDGVRSAAVRALQSMRDPRVDGLLAVRLSTDESSDVRLSALDSIQVREPTEELGQALIQAATVAADANVRFRAVDLMIRWLPERPALQAALQQVASSDTEEKVRNRAKAAL